MALSFEDSLKAAQAESKAAAAVAAIPAVADNTSVMTLDYGIAAADEGGMIEAYSGVEYDSKYESYSNYPQKLVDNKISTIDEDKNIKLSDSQINLTQESNSQYIPFKMSRYYDGYDLSVATLSVYWVNSFGSGSAAAPVNVSYDDAYIYFAWLVDSGVTRYAGDVEFEIQARGSITSDSGLSSSYVWKSRSGKINVIQALEYDEIIEPDEGWQTDFFSQANSILDSAQAAANTSLLYSSQAQSAAKEANTALSKVDAAINDAVDVLEGEIDTIVTEKVSDSMGEYAKTADVEEVYAKKESIPTFVSELENDSNFATMSEVESAIADADLKRYATVEYVGDIPVGDDEAPLAETIVGYVDYKVDSVDVSDQLQSYATHEDVAEAIAAQDITSKLGNYYTKSETYSKSEINEAIENVEVDLSGYYTKTEIDTKTNAISSSVSTNTTSISSLNSAVQAINEELEGIDKSPNAYYATTYNEPYTLEGTEYTGENALVLYEIYNKDTENETRSVVSAHVITGGSGGSTSSNTIKIDRITASPVYRTADERVIIEYTFTGFDASNEDIEIGKATWKVGNRTVKTETVYTGDNSVDLTEFLSVGSDQKVTLIITDDIGTVQQKIWYVNVIDVRLESTFDDTRTYVAGESVTFTYTPYGAIDKTVHFLLDEKEVAATTSSKSATGLSSSYTIPAQEHGTHLFEVYMTSEINGKTIESNHIVKDVIWYDETSEIPVIGTTYQAFTARQYEATNIVYTVYDPLTETPSVTLKSSYVNEDGETVEEYNSNITMSSNTATWQYKTDVIGEHTLTITCGDTVKTLIATITELGIDVSPITTGLAFDFNPVGYSNDDENRIWSSGDIAMSVSDNFDWVNGGYGIDGNGDQYFCIKAGTSAEINYQLFGDDAKANGKQFKLIFKTDNVASSDAMFLSCVSDPTGTGKIGIEMKSQEATIYAKTESLPLPYAEEEVIEFEFNISASNETPSMVMGYEDGVSTRPLVYDDTHDFQQQIGHREIISLGSADCDLYIYRFKVYNTSLSDRDILNNFIADARSAEEMIDRYERNQIYKDGVLDPDYLAEVCPDLRIIKLEVPHFTADKDDKVYDANIPSIVECIYKNGDPIYDNWIAYDVVHSGQGTSSNNYGAAGRNLDIIIKPYKDYGNAPYIVLGDGSQTSKVSLTRESIPVNYFNVKVNIASSENANNALLAKRYNQYNPYKRPFVREDESIIPHIKDTMEFQNCVIFVKESDTDLSTHVEFADNEWHYYALGNIGDSKKTDSTRLTDPDDPYECIIEVMDNTLPNSNMPTGKVDEKGAPVYPIDPSEWTVGNSAYDSLYADLFDEVGGKDTVDGTENGELIKPNGLDDTYGMRYVYEDGTDEENEQYRQAVIDKWREFYGFVVTSTDEEFKAHLGDYVVLNSIMYYYLFTLRYTMTDNHAKNSFWHYGKSNDCDAEGNHIRKWDLCFDYDNDTSLGIDNYGRMTYRYGYEEIDYVDGTQDWVWNCPNHVLFLRLRKLFDTELCELYTSLESRGAWSATGLINQFNEWQMQFPEEVWRLDIERKYIRTYTKSFINGAAKPEFLKERANGRKKMQRSQFEKNQEKYMSSKFGGTVASADDIVLRCSVPNTELVVPKNFDMHLTPYSHVYLNVKYNTAPPVKIRAVPNVEYTIEYTADEADIIEIYSASCLKSIGDLSAAYLINGDFSNASKIRELILGSSVEGYNNTNAMTLGLGSNELLNKLDIQNMSGLTSSLDLSGLKNLEELYAFGSNVSGVIFADGGNVEIAEIPSVGSLQMKNLNYLTDDGFEATSYNALTKLVAENSLLDLIALINNAPNLYQVRLTGINWTLENTALLERLYDLAGVTNAGNNSDQSVLSGYVYVPTIKQQQLVEYNAAWSDLEIEANTTIQQHAVTFVNDDGTILEVQYVDNGAYAVDPLTRDENPLVTPTKESTVSTDYTFAGWDMDLSAVGIREPKTVTATYTESIREYTVKYVSKGTIMQSTVAPYGTNVVYDGEIPTYTLEEGIGSERFYLFDRWDKSGLVDGDKTITAVFDDFQYTEGAFANKELLDMKPVEVYALTRLVEMGVLTVDVDDGISGTNIQTGDDYSFTMGYDIDYEDIESNEIVSERTIFNGTNYIDTGITLFDEDRDFILAIDYKMSSENKSGATIMQCFQTSGSNGFKLSIDNDYNLAWGGSSMKPALADNREMLVIRHKAGDNNLYVYVSDLTSTNLSTYTIEKTTATQSSIATLVLGAAKNDAGRISDYCIGEVNWCKLWYMDLGDEICKKLVSWTHEKITLEVSGFLRYSLHDDFTKESTMSLIATHLLDCKKVYNTTNTVAGGWASSALNSFLNTRFYDAIPYQMKALMKQVSVSSLVGDKTTNTSSSGCYVAIPSAFDVDDTQTSYKAEVYGDTIEFMSSPAMRIKSYADGTVGDYWLRSPDIRYTSYPLYVDCDGNGNGIAGAVYSFTTAYSEMGILIEISL